MTPTRMKEFLGLMMIVMSFSTSGLIMSFIFTGYSERLNIDGFCESMGLFTNTTFCNLDCNTYITADCQPSNDTTIIKFVCPRTQTTHTDVLQSRLQNVVDINTLSANNTFTACWVKVSGKDCSPVMPFDLTNIEPKNSYRLQEDCKALTEYYKVGADELFAEFNASIILFSTILGLFAAITLIVFVISYRKRHVAVANTFKYDLTRFTKEVELT